MTASDTPRPLSRRNALKGAGVAGLALTLPGVASQADAAVRPAPGAARPAHVRREGRQQGGVRFGVNYLPSQNWWYAWEDWNPGAIRADLMAIAGLGFDHIRIQCFWPLLQPNAGYVSTTMLGNLAELLDIAALAGLNVQVTVLDGYLSSFTYYPAWQAGRNIITDQSMITAEQSLFAALAASVARHPAFLGFDLSNEIDMLLGSQPGGVTTDQADTWVTEMLAYCDQVAPGGQHVNGASQNPWFYGFGFSPSTMTSTGAMTVVHYYDFSGNSTTSPANEAEYMVEMVQAYAADPSRQVWLEEFGVSTGAGFWLPPAQLPDFIEEYIRNVMTCTSLWGWTLWASHDIRASLTGFGALEYGFGMLDVDNQPTPVGARVAGLIREFRTSPPQPAVRSTALILPDGMNPTPGSVGQPFIDLIASQGIRPAVVLESRSTDQGYLQARGITQVITIAEVDLLDGPSFSSLASAFNNVGITDDSAVGPGNLDDYGDSYSAQALAAAGLTPGGTVTDRGLSYTWPDLAAGVKDNMQAAGQGVAVPGATAGAAALGFLAAATNGPSTSQVALAYTDGSTAAATLSCSDWTLNGGSASPVTGNDIVATMPYRNAKASGGQQQLKTYVFAAQVPLDTTRTLAKFAVTAPGSGTISIFALATG